MSSEDLEMDVRVELMIDSRTNVYANRYCLSEPSGDFSANTDVKTGRPFLLVVSPALILLDRSLER